MDNIMRVTRKTSFNIDQLLKDYAKRKAIKSHTIKKRRKDDVMKKIYAKRCAKLNEALKPTDNKKPTELEVSQNKPSTSVNIPMAAVSSGMLEKTKKDQYKSRLEELFGEDLSNWKTEKNCFNFGKLHEQKVPEKRGRILKRRMTMFPEDSKVGFKKIFKRRYSEDTSILPDNDSPPLSPIQYKKETKTSTTVPQVEKAKSKSGPSEKSVKSSIRDTVEYSSDEDPPSNTIKKKHEVSVSDMNNSKKKKVTFSNRNTYYKGVRNTNGNSTKVPGETRPLKLTRRRVSQLTTTHFGMSDVEPEEDLEEANFFKSTSIRYCRAKIKIVEGMTESAITLHEDRAEIIEPFIDLTQESDYLNTFTNVQITHVKTASSITVKQELEEEEEIVIRIRVDANPLLNGEIKEEILPCYDDLDTVKQESHRTGTVDLQENLATVSIIEGFLEETVDLSSEPIEEVRLIATVHNSCEMLAITTQVTTYLSERVSSSPNIFKPRGGITLRSMSDLGIPVPQTESQNTLTLTEIPNTADVQPAQTQEDIQRIRDTWLTSRETVTNAVNEDTALVRKVPDSIAIRPKNINSLVSSPQNIIENISLNMRVMNPMIPVSVSVPQSCPVSRNILLHDPQSAHNVVDNISSNIRIMNPMPQVSGPVSQSSPGSRNVYLHDSQTFNNHSNQSHVCPPGCRACAPQAPMIPFAPRMQQNLLPRFQPISPPVLLPQNHLGAPNNMPRFPVVAGSVGPPRMPQLQPIATKFHYFCSSIEGILKNHYLIHKVYREANQHFRSNFENTRCFFDNIDFEGNALQQLMKQRQQFLASKLLRTASTLSIQELMNFNWRGFFATMEKSLAHAGFGISHMKMMEVIQEIIELEDEEYKKSPALTRFKKSVQRIICEFRTKLNSFTGENNETQNQPPMTEGQRNTLESQIEFYVQNERESTELNGGTPNPSPKKTPVKRKVATSATANNPRRNQRTNNAGASPPTGTHLNRMQQVSEESEQIPKQNLQASLHDEKSRQVSPLNQHNHPLRTYPQVVEMTAYPPQNCNNNEINGMQNLQSSATQGKSLQMSPGAQQNQVLGTYKQIPGIHHLSKNNGNNEINTMHSLQSSSTPEGSHQRFPFIQQFQPLGNPLYPPVNIGINNMQNLQSTSLGQEKSHQTSPVALVNQPYGAQQFLGRPPYLPRNYINNGIRNPQNFQSSIAAEKSLQRFPFTQQNQFHQQVIGIPPYPPNIYMNSGINNIQSLQSSSAPRKSLHTSSAVQQNQLLGSHSQFSELPPYLPRTQKNNEGNKKNSQSSLASEKSLQISCVTQRNEPPNAHQQVSGTPPYPSMNHKSNGMNNVQNLQYSLASEKSFQRPPVTQLNQPLGIHPPNSGKPPYPTTNHHNSEPNNMQNLQLSSAVDKSLQISSITQQKPPIGTHPQYSAIPSNPPKTHKNNESNYMQNFQSSFAPEKLSGIYPVTQHNQLLGTHQVSRLPPYPLTNLKNSVQTLQSPLAPEKSLQRSTVTQLNQPLGIHRPVLGNLPYTTTNHHNNEPNYMQNLQLSSALDKSLQLSSITQQKKPSGTRPQYSEITSHPPKTNENNGSNNMQNVPSAFAPEKSPRISPVTQHDQLMGTQVSGIPPYPANNHQNGEMNKMQHAHSSTNPEISIQRSLVNQYTQHLNPNPPVLINPPHLTTNHQNTEQLISMQSLHASSGPEKSIQISSVAQDSPPLGTHPQVLGIPTYPPETHKNNMQNLKSSSTPEEPLSKTSVIQRKQPEVMNQEESGTPSCPPKNHNNNEINNMKNSQQSPFIVHNQQYGIQQQVSSMQQNPPKNSDDNGNNNIANLPPPYLSENTHAIMPEMMDSTFPSDLLRISKNYQAEVGKASSTTLETVDFPPSQQNLSNNIAVITIGHPTTEGSAETFIKYTVALNATTQQSISKDTVVPHLQLPPSDSTGMSNVFEHTRPSCPGNILHNTLVRPVPEPAIPAPVQVETPIENAQESSSPPMVTSEEKPRGPPVVDSLIIDLRSPETVVESDDPKDDSDVVIDLTWMDDNYTKEELARLKELELSGIKDEPNLFSPGDSGIESPPIQIDYPDYIFHDRLCICRNAATYLCVCNNAMYCSRECQIADWTNHLENCMRISA